MAGFAERFEDLLGSGQDAPVRERPGAVSGLADAPERLAGVAGLAGRAGQVHLSLVVPVYNEETALKSFFDRVVPLIRQVTSDFEIICVNDGSSDRSLAHLLRARSRDPRIKIIDFTRNFGKEMAVTAGIDRAAGDVIIPIDADLQDPPELIPDMIAKWREGYEMVVAVRRDRASDSWARRNLAYLFYRVMQRLAEMPVPANAGDFRLMDRQVVEALKRLPERTRFMKGLFAWLGFRQAVITYVRPPRIAGSSKWRYWQLWNFALEGLLSFSTIPLRIWTYFGLLVAATALVYMLYIIVRTLLYGVEVPGYASIVVMLLFFSGMNMIGLGVIGEYIGRIFIETKRRPLYLVRETIGFDAPAGPGAEPGGAASTGQGDGGRPEG